MLSVGQLLNNVDIQCDVKLYYFDYKKYERIEVKPSHKNYGKRIRNIYAEENTILIEFDNE